MAETSPEFIHFRTQSSYSMLESAIKIEALTDLALSDGMPAIALTDRGNLFASLEFSLSAQEKKIQPIHGAILNIKHDFTPASAIQRTHASVQSNSDKFAEILLIAKDEQGYRNLLKLVSMSFTDNPRDVCEHITFDDLKSHQEGIIVLSSYAKGIVGKLLLKGEKLAAEKAASSFIEIFGNRFYFEIMRHGYASERKIEASYLSLANKLKIPLIATNQVLFGDIAMHDAHDVLLCISEGVVRDVQERRRVSNQCYFKSAAKMKELFHDLPEAIQNTVHLAKRCSVMAETRPPSLPNFTDGSMSEEELIRAESKEQLELKLEQKFARENIPKKDQEAIKKEYFDRLDYELDIICKMQFSGYFLIVSDFIRWSKENGIAVGPGRGSGAGSIIAWVLQITGLDPIKFGLLFERFLNPERVSMPDFDIDFCQERREEVIHYVRKKYGDERVGQIITFGKMQAKAVIKDVSRVLGLPYVFADYLTELVPFNAVNPVTLADAIKEVAELGSAAKGKGLYNMDGEEELIKQVLDTALTLEGLHRHASTHAAGIVIANDNMVETVPVYKDSSDSEMLIVQYSMKYSELAGLVKFDFLGLQTLTVITKCLELIDSRGGYVAMDKLGFDDPKTYEMLSKGLSNGVFQLESTGMKSALRRLRPDCIEDIIALGALYRPGPMENIPTYIACKHGEQEADYLHPLLEPILQETNGVIIYQEQVMEIAKRLSGYSLGAADLLRRAMGKKVKAEMDAQEEIFVSGAVENKVPAEQAKSIFATVAKFAGYGFNKSHASAYGVISYQTAYLKANYTTEFLVACLNLDIDNSDKINTSIQEARTFGIKVLSPCVNHSGGYFSISSDEGDNNGVIIFAIGAIKNVTKNFGNCLEEERENRGPFRSVNDFLERIPPKMLNKRLLENIIRAGCFDELEKNRNSLLQSVPKLLAYANSYHTEQNSNQFSLIAVSETNNNILVDAPEFSPEEIALQEFEVLGMFLENHPLKAKADMLNEMDVKDYNHIESLRMGGSNVKLGGVIIKKDSRMSQRGRFVTLLISDPVGMYEITIFSEEVLKEYANLITVKAAVIVECDIYKDDGGVRITAKKFHDVDEYGTGIEHDLSLYPKDSKDVASIISMLDQKEPDKKANSSVTIFLPSDKGYLAKVKLQNEFHLEFDRINKLKSSFG